MIKYKSYLAAGTFEALTDIYICELCYFDILLNHTIYACMLAEQLNISETGLPLQCYAFT